MTEIQVPGQFLGSDTMQFESVLPGLVSALRKTLTGTYSLEFKCLGLILRVDGELGEFKNLPEAPRISNIERYVTVDASIGVAEWRGKSDTELKTLLIDKLRQGLIKVLDYLECKSRNLIRELLFRDFE